MNILTRAKYSRRVFFKRLRNMWEGAGFMYANIIAATGNQYVDFAGFG